MANQNHLDALRAENDAKQQLMQDMIKGEFKHKGAIHRWKGTPEQNAKLDAAVNAMDTSFSQETAKISAAAEKAARAEVKANEALWPKTKPAPTVRESIEANLGPSDIPPHPKSAPKEAAPVRPYAAADLHQAWLDLGEVSGNPMAVKKVRDLLINVMERDMDPGTVTAFRKMNKEYGITRDLTRMYQGGAGEGTGTSAGYLSVDQLKRMAATHDMSKETNEALQAANRFGVKDPVPQSISSETGYAAIRDVAQGVVGKGAHWVDQLTQKIADPRSPEGRKKLIEMLRAATERVVPSTVNTNRERQ